jgi:hypothetical protein
MKFYIEFGTRNQTTNLTDKEPFYPIRLFLVLHLTRHYISDAF